MEKQVLLPNIGDFDKVDVVAVLVQPGAKIATEATLITLESDKAAMDIPSPYAGEVKSVAIKVGDKIGAGELIAVMDVDDDAPGDTASATPTSAPDTLPVAEPQDESLRKAVAERSAPRPPPAVPQTAETVRGSRSAQAYAGPAVRRFARELGVDLGLVKATGNRGRITQDDVKNFTRSTFTGHTSGGRSVQISDLPQIDYSKFGPVELKALGKIKRRAGEHLLRSWLTVPGVTQFDEADITDLEEFRKAQLPIAKQRQIKLTLVAFLCKAVVVALKKFPDFNASLTSDGEALVRKKYFHIGIAVNTDHGLLVPVVRDVDQKGLFDIAAEIQYLSDTARAGKVEPRTLQGGCFSISSLGGIGGTGFTPIVNTPEVAILGVSRAVLKPVWKTDTFVPRLTLPFALTYDHRVIDGVAGAQFARYLAEVLTDIRQILL